MARVITVLFYILFCLVPCKSFDKNFKKEIKDLIKSQDATKAEEKSGLFEGDIVMDEGMQRALTSDGLTARDAVINPIYRWPDGKVYYKFDDSIPRRARYKIRRAFKHIEKHTCITFHNNGDNEHRHHVVFFRGNGCFSRVGRSPKKYLQKISIAKGCERLGTIVHESMHALGFFHEHTRPDRDKFVKIEWSEIKKRHMRNFKKYPRYLGSNLGKPYDYRSVMHYSEYAFAKDGFRTIIPKDPHAIIGQRIGLSYYDAYQINKLYKCKVSCKDKSSPFFCLIAKKRGFCDHRKCRLYCKKTCGYCRKRRIDIIPHFIPYYYHYYY